MTRAEPWPESSLDSTQPPPHRSVCDKSGLNQAKRHKARGVTSAAETLLSRDVAGQLSYMLYMGGVCKGYIHTYIWYYFKYLRKVGMLVLHAR